jgi:hypothetical protein
LLVLINRCASNKIYRKKLFIHLCLLFFSFSGSYLSSSTTSMHLPDKGKKGWKERAKL